MIINQVRNPVVDEIDCLELQRRLLDETRALLAEVRAERQAIFTVFLKHADVAMLTELADVLERQAQAMRCGSEAVH
jgi:hypothetical protein